MNTSVHTITGPVPAHELGFTLSVRALLGILPGAELAPENDCSTLTSFNELRERLTELRDLGVGTVVDRGGMALGRDLYLYEVLSKETGVRIIGSTGMGEQSHVGSHFTHPTSMHLKPATPLQDEELSSLYTAEIEEGMVIPRVCRSSHAGLVSVGASAEGLTDFEAKSFRAAAQTAIRTGVPVVVRTGADPITELDVVTGQGLPASRVVLANIDREGMEDTIRQAVSRGAAVSFDNTGRSHEDGFLDDTDRIDLILSLAEAGHGGQITVGADGYGRGVALPEVPVSIAHAVGQFIPALRARGASDELVEQILSTNVHRLLAMHHGSDLTREESK